MIPNGTYPTMITPYTAKGEVDYEAVGALTKWYWKKGCAGIFAVCQSSEAFFLSLKERVSLSETIVRKAKELNALGERAPLFVAASGHVSESPEAQAEELTQIGNSGADSVVLITNRLDIGNTSEKKWIAEMSELLNNLPRSFRLGLYEAPVPYKRLLTPRMLEFCASDGRFVFLKDTSCDAATLQSRCELLKGSKLKLFNANAQTLLLSLKAGAGGYCGVMANFFPELLNRLCSQFDGQDAERIQDFVSLAAFTETLHYPMTAKYYLSAYESISMQLISRSRRIEGLPDYDRMVVDGLVRATRRLENTLS